MGLFCYPVLRTGFSRRCVVLGLLCASCLLTFWVLRGCERRRIDPVSPGGLTIHYAQRRESIAGNVVEHTANAGLALTYGYLLWRVWGPGTIGTVAHAHGRKDSPSQRG